VKKGAIASLAETFPAATARRRRRSGLKPRGRHRPTMRPGRLHARLLSALDPYARRVGLYTAYRLTEPERLGAVAEPGGVAGVARRLRDRGYGPQWLAAAKRHPADADRVAVGSYRRVPARHPDVDARLVDDWRPVDCQFHVHPFPDGDGVDLYGHYELRPDLLAPRADPARLRTHYRPTWGETYLRGVLDPRLADALPLR
jgi:hypothetical protein